MANLPASPQPPAFHWEYSEKGRLQVSGLAPVNFDTSIPRVKRWLTRTHRRNRMHEPPFAYVLINLIKQLEPRIFFDVGAHMGYFTLLAAALERRDMEIYSFEMNPNTYHSLKQNLSLNSHLNIDNVHPIHAGISDLTVFKKQMYYRGMRLSDTQMTDFKETTIDVLSLDHLFAERQLLPDLIKIDVEGFEAAVLKGAQQLIAREAPTLLMELHADDRLQAHGATRKSITQGLLDSGYHVFAIEEHRLANFDLHSLLVPIDRADHEVITDQENSALVATRRDLAALTAG